MSPSPVFVTIDTEEDAWGRYDFGPDVHHYLEPVGLPSTVRPVRRRPHLPCDLFGRGE